MFAAYVNGGIGFEYRYAADFFPFYALMAAEVAVFYKRPFGRRLMLGEGLDAGEAAFRVGYESPSQFGREYRRMFGTSPRRDVVALKVEATPAKKPGLVSV